MPSLDCLTVPHSLREERRSPIATTREHGAFGQEPGPGRTLSFATATRLKDGEVLVVGGYDDHIAVAADAWLLRP